jgi:GTPase
MSGLIAIVGRPNVGKSALFNRIVGRRIAIVHDQPGVTRDRVSAEAEWHGRGFTLVDTGGLGLLQGEKASDLITRAALDQARIAIDAAQVLVLVVDAAAGLAPLDYEVASQLRACGKPVLVAANKVDEARRDPLALEFAELGFDRVYPVSAIHGRGLEPLLDAAVGMLPAATGPRLSEPEEPPLKIAIVGRPNVGKSSLVNALTRSERVVVTPIPGTTRDAIDVPFEVVTDGVRQRYVLIDTAGIRKTRRVHTSLEFFSVNRAEESIRRSDLVLFMLDAQSGILEQDKKIADRILDAHRACILVVNKWDLFQQAVAEAQARERHPAPHTARKANLAPRHTLAQFAAWVQKTLFFLDYAPVVFTSAQSGFHLDRLLESVRYVAAQLQQKIPTAIINRTLHDAIERKPPGNPKGLHLKFFYATQTALNPPTFLLFVNHPQLLTDAYQKHLTRELRRAFGYEGCAIRLEPRARTRTVEPIRAQKQRRDQKNQGRRSRKNVRKRASFSIK